MHPEHECEKMNLRPSKGKSKPKAHKTHTQHTQDWHRNQLQEDWSTICEVPLVCPRLCTTSLLPLTSKVIHEAGLGGNDPLGSRLAEDGDVVFWALAERRQATAQLTRRFEDVLIGEPTVLTQDHLQGADKQSSALLM